jgi:CRISPR type III-B/RAMP module RAMP protein Cmr6
MARIPIVGDVAELIGPCAEKVENRSLLLDKFAFHKDWDFDGFRANDAHRWSLMRISDHGSSEILRDSQDRREEASRLENKNPEKSKRLSDESEIAERLASTRVEGKDVMQMRVQHTRRFIGLFRSAFGDRAVITVGQLEGRLAINLADSLIQNAGICLDRLFGLPFIPGSAVKGVCRAAALEELKQANSASRKQLFDSFRRVFGTAETDFNEHGELCQFCDLLAAQAKNQKGAISFLPAYPINEAKIIVDLTNVHYPLYYGGDRRRNIPAGQTDSLAEEKPQPNPFPAVEVGAQFGFCLVLNGIDPEAALLKRAASWLETAIAVRGLGAKTAAGYGWFSLQSAVLQQLLEEERRETEAIAAKVKAEADTEAKAAAEQQRLAALSPEGRAVEALLQLPDEAFAAIARNLAAKPEPEQIAFLRLLREHKNKRDRWKTWKKKKPDLAAAIEAVRKKLNVPALP